MTRLVFIGSISLILCLSLNQKPAVGSDAREVDPLHSTMTVRVYKSGFLSAFGHNHEIQAPVVAHQNAIIGKIKRLNRHRFANRCVTKVGLVQITATVGRMPCFFTSSYRSQSISVRCDKTPAAHCWYGTIRAARIQF